MFHFFFKYFQGISRDAPSPSIALRTTQPSSGSISGSISSSSSFPEAHLLHPGSRFAKPGHVLNARKQWCAFAFIGLFFILSGLIGIIIWLLLASSFSALEPSEVARPDTFLHTVARNWTSPKSLMAFERWPENFTRGILPAPCHSHNDYERHAPLYSALAAGCTGVEADIWLEGDELLVGHTRSKLKSDWTLLNLYLDPLLGMIKRQNAGHSVAEESRGIFDGSPNRTVVLMLDFKSNGTELWPKFNIQLQKLRDRDWLTYWDAEKSSQILRPLTIVASGDTPFDLIRSSANHDIFYDAPLAELGEIYNQSNSYYASSDIHVALGKVSRTLTSGQLQLIKEQAAAAKARGLLSRYWDTPSWPMSVRHRVWEDLYSSGVGMLNVDDVEAAARFDWDAR